MSDHVGWKILQCRPLVRRGQTVGNRNNGQERCLSPRPDAAVAFTQHSQPEAFTRVLFDWPAFLRKVRVFSIPLGIPILQQ